MFHYILDLHPPTHSLIGHSQRVRGAASKALAEIGGEHSAGAGDTGPFGWRVREQNIWTETHLLEHRADCLCAKGKGNGLHSVPVELKTSKKSKQNKGVKNRLYIPTPCPSFKKTSYEKRKVCFHMNLPVSLLQHSSNTEPYYTNRTHAAVLGREL